MTSTPAGQHTDRGSRFPFCRKAKTWSLPFAVTKMLPSVFCATSKARLMPVPTTFGGTGCSLGNQSGAAIGASISFNV